MFAHRVDQGRLDVSRLQRPADRFCGTETSGVHILGPLTRAEHDHELTGLLLRLCESRQVEMATVGNTRLAKDDGKGLFRKHFPRFRERCCGKDVHW